MALENRDALEAALIEVTKALNSVGLEGAKDEALVSLVSDF